VSDGPPYPIGFRVRAPEPFGPVSAATIVACDRVGETETWAVTREHDSGPRVTTLWPAVRLEPLS
jgi:hypothetical protein